MRKLTTHPFAMPPMLASDLMSPYGYLGPLFDPDPPAQGGGGSGSGAGGDPEAAFQSGLRQANNDALSWARELYRDNAQLRERNRKLRGGQVPEGGLALTAEQAQAYQAYQALGAPADLTAQIGELATLRTEAAANRRRQQIAEAAGVAGYDPDVLGQLLGEAEIEVRSVTDPSGKQVSQALIKDNDVMRPLEEVASQRWAKFLPALQAQGGQGQQGSQAAGQGTRFVPQGSGGRAPASDPVAKRIEQDQAKQAERKNPLQRQ